MKDGVCTIPTLYEGWRVHYTGYMKDGVQAVKDGALWGGGAVQRADTVNQETDELVADLSKVRRQTLKK